MALVVFTGGARSGKSTLAQDLGVRRSAEGTRLVVAVFGDATADSEMGARIQRHQADRPEGAVVVEATDSRSWLDSVSDDDLLLVDCLGTLLARAIDEEIASVPAAVIAPVADDDGLLPLELESNVEARFAAILDALIDRSGDTIVVTNEVGDGVIPAYASGRLFRDVLGRANRRLVAAADAAYLVVCGRALDIAGLSSETHWPTD